MVNQPEQPINPSNAFQILDMKILSKDKDSSVQQPSIGSDPLNQPPDKKQIKSEQELTGTFELKIKGQSGELFNLIVTVTEGKIESVKDSVEGAAVSADLVGASLKFEGADKLCIVIEETFVDSDIEKKEVDEDQNSQKDEVQFLLDDTFEDVVFEDDDNLDNNIELDETGEVQKKEDVKQQNKTVKAQPKEDIRIQNELNEIDKILGNVDLFDNLAAVAVQLLEVGIQQSVLLESVADVELPFVPDELIQDLGLDAILETFQIADAALQGGLVVSSGFQAGKKVHNQIKAVGLKKEKKTLNNKINDLKEKLESNKHGNNLLTLDPTGESYQKFSRLANGKLLLETILNSGKKINEDKVEKLKDGIQNLEDKLNSEFGSDVVGDFTELIVCELKTANIDKKLGLMKAESKHAYRHFALNTLKEGKSIATLAGKTVVGKIINIPIQAYRLVKNAKGTYDCIKLRDKLEKGAELINGKRKGDLKTYQNLLKNSNSKKLDRETLEKNGVKVGKNNLLGLKENFLRSNVKRASFGAIFKFTQAAMAAVTLAAAPFGIAAGLGALGIITVGGLVTTLATGGTLLIGVLGVGLLVAAVGFIIFKNKEKIRFFFESKLKKRKLDKGSDEMKKFEEQQVKHKALLKVSQNLDMKPQFFEDMLKTIIGTTNQQERQEIQTILGADETIWGDQKKAQQAIIKYVFTT